MKKIGKAGKVIGPVVTFIVAQKIISGFLSISFSFISCQLCLYLEYGGLMYLLHIFDNLQQFSIGGNLLRREFISNVSYWIV